MAPIIHLDYSCNTPLVKISITNLPNVSLYAKLEFYNPTGSVKDRAAYHILDKLIREGIIDQEYTIMESSSGNFGVALAAYCRKYGLKFICVIDPNISPLNKILIESFEGKIEEVTVPDQYGGCLLNRIKRVKELKESIKKSYWVNQYENPLNAEAYHLLGQEIFDGIKDVDYIFMGVSSGGTITGVSQKIKEISPKTKIIAVDIVGSIIFGGSPAKRYIPGIGSSMVPTILKQAKIDDVVMVNEVETIYGCHQLLRSTNIFAGGSSGTVYAAVKKFFTKNPVSGPVNAVCIFADSGERYANTVYNEDWYTKFKNMNTELKNNEKDYDLFK